MAYFFGAEVLKDTKKEKAMNNLQIFNHPDFGEVRTVSIDNEPLFVGKDVADILGYANPRKAIIDHVDEEDKGVTKCEHPWWCTRN